MLSAGFGSNIITLDKSFFFNQKILVAKVPCWSRSAFNRYHRPKQNVPYVITIIIIRYSTTRAKITWEINWTFLQIETITDDFFSEKEFLWTWIFECQTRQKLLINSRRSAYGNFDSKYLWPECQKMFKLLWEFATAVQFSRAYDVVFIPKVLSKFNTIDKFFELLFILRKFKNYK